MVCMCPDRQVISLYIDGELPSPWKEKLEVHLESCPDCRAVLNGYRRLGAELHRVELHREKLPGENSTTPPEEALLAAKERVWNKLGDADFTKLPKKNRAGIFRKPLWSRSITLPLPAAAAAAALIIAVFLMLLEFGQRPPQQDFIAVLPDPIQMVTNVQETIPMHDMSRILQYLTSQDHSDVMIIRLPENRRFYHTGEPVLINAVDYSRRHPSR